MEPESIGGGAVYDLGFVNTAGAGESVELRMRGRVSEESSALMWGNMPGELGRDR